MSCLKAHCMRTRIVKEKWSTRGSVQICWKWSKLIRLYWFVNVRRRCLFGGVGTLWQCTWTLFASPGPFQKFLLCFCLVIGCLKAPQHMWQRIGSEWTISPIFHVCVLKLSRGECIETIESGGDSLSMHSPLDSPLLDLITLVQSCGRRRAAARPIRFCRTVMPLASHDQTCSYIRVHHTHIYMLSYVYICMKAICVHLFIYIMRARETERFICIYHGWYSKVVWHTHMYIYAWMLYAYTYLYI